MTAQPVIVSPSQAAWDASADWAPMLIALATPGAVDRRALVRALASCVRTALPLVPAGENRPGVAVDLVAQWAEGSDVGPEAIDDASDACREVVDDVVPVPPWHYVALAAAGVCDCVTGCSILRDAMDVASNAVTALVEDACAAAHVDGPVPRGTVGEAVDSAMQVVLATILRGHFPIAPTTWHRGASR
jgi:hypothetical protein